MDTVVGRPLVQARQRLVGVSLQIRPDAELGGEPLRQLVLGVHRRFEVLEALLCDEHHERQIQERVHPRQIGILDLRPEGVDDDSERFCSIGWQVHGERGSDVTSTRREFQVLVSVERVGDERVHRKGPMNAHHHLGEPRRDIRSERVLEWFGHLIRLQTADDTKRREYVSAPEITTHEH